MEKGLRLLKGSFEDAINELRAKNFDAVKNADVLKNALLTEI